MDASQWDSWCNTVATKQHYTHQDIQNIQETLDTFNKQQRRMLWLIIGLVITNGILLYFK